MHMADALLSPATGAAMMAVSGGTLLYSSAKINQEKNERNIPLMGMLGAFVFASQMINFTIPGVGSSGHLGGGLLLAMLLGPYASFLVMASILTVQALFFADGGLLALGCNVFNLGFIPAYVVYPFIRRFCNRNTSDKTLAAVSIAGAVVALQIGAFGVVLQTWISGISELPFTTFLAVMLPIHLAIGLVEGCVTGAVVNFIRRAEPGIIENTPTCANGVRNVLLAMGAATLIVGGLLSLEASEYPDGLEWSISKVTGTEELEREPQALHSSLAEFQESTAVLPDYGFKANAETASPVLGTSVSGIAGSVVTLLIIALIGILCKRKDSSLQSEAV